MTASQKTTTNLGYAVSVDTQTLNVTGTSTLTGTVRTLNLLDMTGGRGAVLKNATKLVTNPASPVPNQINILSATSVNVYTGAAWVPFTPQVGYVLWDTTNSALQIWNGTAFRQI